MSKLTLEAITEGYNNANKNNSTFGDFVIKDYLQIWKFPEDMDAVIRFLPDANEENPLGFLVERHTHQLEAKGPLYLSLKQHGGQSTCPFAEYAGSFYEEAKEASKVKNAPLEQELTALGKRFYRKKAYLGKALLISSTIPELADHVGSVMKLELGPAIFAVIQAAFKSGNFNDLPDSLDKGCNFKVIKTKKGEYANYDSSGFIYRIAPLTGKNLEAAKAGIEDLKNLITDNATLLSNSEATQVLAPLKGATPTAPLEQEPAEKKPVSAVLQQLKERGLVKAAESKAEEKEPSF